MSGLNPLRLILCTAVLAGICPQVNAQETFGKKAVMVIQADMKAFYNSKIIETLGGKDRYFRLMGGGPAELDFIRKMERIDIYVAAPEGGPDPETLMSTNFLAVLRMSDKAVATRMEDELRGGFVEDEMDGKKVLRAEGPGAPPFFAVREGNVLKFASKEFLFAKPESLIGNDLKPLLKGLGKAQVKMVANFDGARDFLDATADLANENADFMSRQYISLLNQIATMQVSYDVDGEKLVYVRMTGHNEDENGKIKLKMEAAIGLLKGFAEIGMAQLKGESEATAKLAQAMIDSLEVKGDKESTIVQLKRPKDFEKLLKASFDDVRAASNRFEDANRMRQIALAKHNYFEVHRQFPFAESRTKNLSWRVNVLPFMEEERLFEKFDPDKKWSSEANNKLIGEFPKLFQLSSGGTVSYIKPDNLPKKFTNILDGTSQTIVFVENRKAKMTPWTQPEGLSPKEFATMVENLADGDYLLVAFYDGSVRRISNKTSQKTILKLCNPSDGEIIEGDEIK